MKKLLLGACLLSMSTAGIAADDVENMVGPYINAHYSWYEFAGSRNITDDGIPGGSLGWQFNKNWALEGFLNSGDFDLENNLGNFDVDHYGIDLLYHFGGRGGTSPFARIGYGQYDIDQGGDTDVLKVGIGAEHFFTDRLSIRGAIDLLRDTDENVNDSAISLGLGYFFGKITKAAAAPAAPVDGDADGDGVRDSLDRCPGTPAGVAVDSNGCPLDSDGDGVPDYRDQCANTPRGARVDENGCRIVLEEKVTINLLLNFDTNKHAVKPDMVPEIAKVAEFMRQYPDVDVVLNGHTDSVGDADYNQELSERRAKSVMMYLADNFGIDTGRMTAVGHGETQPVASNDTAEGRRQNRRTEAQLETVVEVEQ